MFSQLRARLQRNPAPTKPQIDTDEDSTEKDSSGEGNVDEKTATLEPSPAKPIAVNVKGGNADVSELEPDSLLPNGKERPLETTEDIAYRCISLEDDPTMLVMTLRMWVIGLGLTCFAATLAQIFYFRPQTVYVSQLFVQIISYLLGKLWYRVLPKADKSRFWAFVNPCDFNIKEHVAIGTSNSTSLHSAGSVGVFAVEVLYYGLNLNNGIAIFSLIASQCFGYSLAGLSRSLCVYPCYALYPTILPAVSLYDALGRDPDSAVAKKRWRFFWCIAIGIFIWEWIPEYVAPSLIGISVFWCAPCRMAPWHVPRAPLSTDLFLLFAYHSLAHQHSPWVTRIFGGASPNEGMGMFSVSLDWNFVGSGGGSLGALFSPLSTLVSLYIGFLTCIVVSLACYAKNVWHAQNFPFLAQDLFYLNGTQYDQSLILDDKFQLNKTALAIQGLPWYSTTTAIYYLGCNLAIGCSITHIVLWFRPQIRKAWAQCEYMSEALVYPEVPLSWYLAIMAGSLSMALATTYSAHSQLPWWALLVTLLTAMIMYPIKALMYGIVGFKIDTAQLSQMLGAALVPGNSRANLYFTLYGDNTTSQAIGLSQDLKMGQYTKIPPRHTLICQLAGTILGGILQIVVMSTIVSNQRDILLSVQGTSAWSGQQVQGVNSAAVTCKQMYSSDRPYFLIPMSIIIGLFVPIPFYFLHKFFPRLHFDKFVTPVWAWCIGNLSVGINSSIFTTFSLAMLSQYYLRRYKPTWFRKYNYLLSAALDELMVFVATFAVQGGAGVAVNMPLWALNPDQSKINADCKYLQALLERSLSTDCVKLN
ncbi:BQ5605_C003g02205 [Microbotryum silenes-dioicae]|uniref:BQ5605_C003g02205 protein n=1 Tax=Microbotryum silenes-dioicae TaxID=796604 RepID=A0A2X0M135_9BASI|nr:BQ5605_C003g02205 [Microbotryum silenes-dioicae]